MSHLFQKDDKIFVTKAPSFSGRVRVPGDKSISHRALMLGAIAEGRTEIEGFLSSNDCLSTMSCLKELGVEFNNISKTALVIEGRGRKSLKEPKDVLFAGNSGTTMRMLPGILAGQNFFSVLTGDSSIRERPMGRIISPLKEMGASLFARDDGNKPPVAIIGSTLSGIDYEMPVASAQVKSCILLAGLFAKGKTRVIEKVPSRDHSERMLAFFDADISSNNGIIEISAEKELLAAKVEIPGDISSAAFLLAAALMIEDSDLRIDSVGVNPTRCGFLEALAMMGASVIQGDQKVISNEPRANLSTGFAPLQAIEIDAEMIPRIVDELPIFAVLSTQAKGTTIVRGAGELRVKESDRITAITSELKSLGADIKELADGFEVKGPSKLKGTKVDSYGDHRMAMALTVAGLIAEGETVIDGAASVDISFPGFIETINSLVKGE
ncbi:MAG: 3-phosphoshikimate 1-carboxyvinyltransferase [Actinomycetota bacterium]|nr:3-phosphoshikimate 1-carboxyvinyltransferase [Actinomycetota bacterium]